MKRKNLEIILWLACLELIRYTITRALRIGITHDEAYTFIHYVPKSFHGIVYYDPPLIPNNHILNTLLIKLSTFLFGVSEFTLRLPNLLFHLLYLIFSMWWLKGFKDKWVLIIGFILLNVNVYLLDFFSLARGYGMGAALCFISIYHTFKHKDTQRVKYIYFAFLTAALSVYANFTFLYFYLALAGLFNLIFLLQRKGFTRLLRLNIPILLVSAVLAFIIFVPLTHIQSDLFGGSSNFWDDTVYTWTYSYMYHT
ncbi:MAG: ArnT family glycosyltransferase, partial [Owenweeksia sp.]